MGAEVVSEIGENATHLVVAAKVVNRKVITARTVKYLTALLKGRTLYFCLAISRSSFVLSCARDSDREIRVGCRVEQCAGVA